MFYVMLLTYIETDDYNLYIYIYKVSDGLSSLLLNEIYHIISNDTSKLKISYYFFWKIVQKKKFRKYHASFTI